LPTYEYECTKCGIVFEEFQSITAPKRQRCPHCRSKVERLISGGTGVVFRGKGFYVTDSRPSSSPSDGKKDEKAATATKDAASSDAKADGTTKGKTSSPATAT
jgi:putative FmdB family regulatory protein